MYLFIKYLLFYLVIYLSIYLTPDSPRHPALRVQISFFKLGSENLTQQWEDFLSTIGTSVQKYDPTENFLLFFFFFK